MTIKRTVSPRKQTPKQRSKRQSEGEAFQWSTIRPSKTPIAKRGAGKAKRQARNAAYYKSAEWKAKRLAVFERDGFQCTEEMPYDSRTHLWGERCPARGEIVNGKQTGRGLVCEEVGYMHRGIPDRIDTCTTRCRDCDRRLTPLERINHSHGFNNNSRG